MSKIEQKKAAQGYVKDAACCKHCAHFLSDMVPMLRWEGDPYVAEKNKRCGIGGFAVQSSSFCNEFIRQKAHA